jgi:broad specificity phosphatase PhoE
MSVVPNLLVLVRHGQSARNAAKTGHVFFPDDAARAPFVGTADQDAALTDKGWAEARAVGAGLKERFGTFDVVFHSGYRRTRDTTAAILEAWPETERAEIEVREHILLRERDTGYTANMTAAGSPRCFPGCRILGRDRRPSRVTRRRAWPTSPYGCAFQHNTERSPASACSS